MRTRIAPPPDSVVTFEHTVPVCVIDDLDALVGPTSGVVTLPRHLDWSRSSSYDLSRHNRVRTMYATVLREAGDEEELASYLHRDLLLREWAHLNLPAAIRRLWEEAHPELAWR